MRSLLVLLAGLSACLDVPAAPKPVDLGGGLDYVRVHSLGDDTPALSASTAKALVVDLRHATASEETTAAFSVALKQRTADAQVFILLSPSTPRTLAKALEQLPGKAVTLGTANARPKPRIVVQTENTDDRAAYDAYETGTPLDQLISGKIEKERYDEATLVQEFKDGHATVPAETETTSPESESENKVGEPEAKKMPPTDRVLQRAVHLHRALLALEP